MLGLGDREAGRHWVTSVGEIRRGGSVVTCTDMWGHRYCTEYRCTGVQEYRHVGSQKLEL